MKNYSKKVTITLNPAEFPGLMELTPRERGRWIRFAMLEKQRDNEREFNIKTSMRNFCVRNDAHTAWYGIRANINLLAKTESDCGSVVVGNSEQQFYIANGRGDGLTRIGIWNSEQPVPSFTHFETMLNALEPLAIFNYDCGTFSAEEITAMIPQGCYEVYSYEGIVILKHDTYREKVIGQ